MSETTDDRSEVSIMDRFRLGDEGVLRWLLSHVVPEIGPMLQHRFHASLSSEELEDVVSEALLKLWRHRTAFDAAKGDLQGWFYVIARNVALDRIRKTRRAHAPAAPVLVVEEKQRSPDGIRARDEALAKAFATLNYRERLAVAPLFQSAQNQPTMRELGRKLKLSEGGVRALRFRGLRKLTQLLESMGYQVTRLSSKKVDGLDE